MWTDLIAFGALCTIALASFLLQYRTNLHLIRQNSDLETKLMQTMGFQQQVSIQRGGGLDEIDGERLQRMMEQAVFGTANGADGKTPAKSAPPARQEAQ